MQSPFAIFRKHARILTVVLTGLAMFAFIIMDQLRPEQFPMILGAMIGTALFWVLGHRRGQSFSYAAIGCVFGAIAGLYLLTPPGPANVVVTNVGNISDNEMQMLRYRRDLANRFLTNAYYRAMGDESNQFQLQNMLFSFGGEPEQDVVMGYLLRHEAEQLGIVVDDQAVTNYINQVTSNKLSRTAFEEIRREMRTSSITIFDAIRDELQARLAMQMSAPRLMLSPEEYWELYRKMNVRQTLNVAAVPAEAFASEVADPAEGELAAFFELYADKFPNQVAEGSPGFRQPRKLQISYVEADYVAIEKQLAEITDEEVKAYYEANKDLYRNNPLPAVDMPMSDKTEPAVETMTTTEEKPKAEEEKPAATEKPATETESPAAEKPAADSKPAPAKKDEAPADKSAEKKPAEKADPPADKKKADAQFYVADPAPAEKPAEKKEAAPAKKEPVTEKQPAPAKKAETPAEKPAEKAAKPAATKEPAKEPKKEAVTEPAQKPAEKPAAEKPAEKPAKEEPAKQPAEMSPPKKQDGGPDLGIPPAPTDAKKTPPKPPLPEYRPLDDSLKSEIRDQLLRERTLAAMEEKIKQAFEQMIELEMKFQPAEEAKEAEKEVREGEVEESNVEYYSPKEMEEKLKELATKLGLKYYRTEPLSARELRDSEEYPIGMATEPVKNPFERQSAQTVVDQLFETDPQSAYVPQIAEDPLSRNRFAYWKIKDFEPRTPKLDDPGIKEQVVKAWKLQQAKPKAKERAEALAELVRKQENHDFRLALDGQKVADQEGASPLSVQTTEPFSWLRLSSAPSANPFAPQTPELSTISAIDGAGEQFMKTVFDDLADGEVGVASNFEETEYYVVQVQGRRPSTEEGIAAQREAFLKENLFFMFSPFTFLARAEQQQALMEWNQQFIRKYDLQWMERPKNP